MRYLITKKIRDIIRDNHRLLKHSDFVNQYNNLLYKNKSISQDHLENLCVFLKLDPKKMKSKDLLISYNYPMINI